MTNKLEISRELASELAPCPLCGAEAETCGYADSDQLFVQCTDCGCSVEVGSGRFEIWNDRAAPVVERQEPVALSQQVAARYAKLNELAVEAALSATVRYSCMPKDKDENWKPHSWVIAAMDKAVQFYAEPPAPVAVVPEPDSCDAANEENAPTFMGEPNVSHPISWYQEGIAKHWKTICAQRLQIEKMNDSLKFYADRDHYSIDDGLNWDSCSGEPSNILWHEEQPWFIEDGSVARACLDKVKEMNE